MRINYKNILTIVFSGFLALGHLAPQASARQDAEISLNSNGSYDDMIVVYSVIRRWDVEPVYDDSRCQFLRKKAFLAESDSPYPFLSRVCDMAHSVIANNENEKNVIAARNFLTRISGLQDIYSDYIVSIINDAYSEDGQVRSFHPKDALPSWSAEYTMIHRTGVIQAGLDLFRDDRRFRIIFEQDQGG